MKLNCDLGEKVHDNDAVIMPYIDMANIACGFHASDPLTISNTIKLALNNKVSIGAHPSYDDRENFGRLSISYTPNELLALIQYQLGAMYALCLSHNASLAYVKPHGALYNDMMRNLTIFEQVCQAVATFNSSLPLVIQAIPDTAPFKAIALKYKLSLLFEAFADREYTDEGLLVARTENNAVIHCNDKIVERCETLLTQQHLVSVNGKPLSLNVDTLCVHGDNPAAIEVVKALNTLLKKHGK